MSGSNAGKLIRPEMCTDIYLSEEYMILNSVMVFMLRCGLEFSLYDDTVDEPLDTLMLRFCMRFEKK